MFRTSSFLLLTLVVLASCGQSITNEEAKAAFTLAQNYHYGVNGMVDMEKAAMYYTQAAEGGLPEAQFNLGNLYFTGSGVALNHKEAVAWFRKAAEQGVPQAQHNLANAYRNGDGIEQNYERAVQWYRNAANRGFAASQYNLGAMYGNGEGIPQDYADAYYWLLLSSKQGYGEATKYLRNFTPDIPLATRARIRAEVEQAHAALVQWQQEHSISSSEQSSASSEVSEGQ